MSEHVPEWVHMADVPPTDTVSCCDFACYEDPGCACPGCQPGRYPDDDGHPEAVIAWIAIALLAWLVVGVIVWMVWHE